jgi:hypothetical protein
MLLKSLMAARNTGFKFNRIATRAFASPRNEIDNMAASVNPYVDANK